MLSTEVANVYILRLFSMQEPVDIGRLTLRQVPQEFVWCTYSQQISEVWPFFSFNYFILYLHTIGTVQQFHRVHFSQLKILSQT